MAHIFTRGFRVRGYECDPLGHVNNAVYQQYLEQASIEASTALGYEMAWYEANGTAWIIRQISVEYLHPGSAGDIIDVTTWVSRWRPVRAQREYEIHRQSDGRLIARASAEWVYVDRHTGGPRRIPAEFPRIVGVAEKAVLRPYRLPPQGLNAGSFHWYHRVKRYELDTMEHVNNAVYLHWVEEAKFSAAASVGWPVERMRAEDFVTVQIRHDTEYFAPAVYGDEIDVVSRLYDLRRVRGTWLHEIRRIGSGELLARNFSTGAFLSLEGRPSPAPQAMLDALLQGAPPTVSRHSP